MYYTVCNQKNKLWWKAGNKANLYLSPTTPLHHSTCIDMHELEYMKEKLLLLCIILYAIRKTNSGGRPGTRLTYTYHLLHLCIIVHVLTCMSWNTETINLSFVAMPISPTVSVKTKGHKLMNKDQNFQVYNIVFATPLGRRFISIQEKCQT